VDGGKDQGAWRKGHGAWGIGLWGLPGELLRNGKLIPMGREQLNIGDPGKSCQLLIKRQAAPGFNPLSANYFLPGSLFSRTIV
jgi:hypothetical protein